MKWNENLTQTLEVVQHWHLDDRYEHNICVTHVCRQKQLREELLNLIFLIISSYHKLSITDPGYKRQKINYQALWKRIPPLLRSVSVKQHLPSPIMVSPPLLLAVAFGCLTNPWCRRLGTLCYTFISVVPLLLSLVLLWPTCATPVAAVPQSLCPCSSESCSRPWSPRNGNKILLLYLIFDIVYHAAVFLFPFIIFLLIKL